MAKNTRNQEDVVGYVPKKLSDSIAGTANAEGRADVITRHAPPQEVIDLYREINEQTMENYAKLQKIAQSKPMPVGMVQWMHINDVQANDYNPNAVASNEMRLLHTSISEDGYTMPVVAIWDDEVQKAIIVDGFHRYTTMRRYQDVYDSTWGFLPVALIQKSIADRIASTVRHNRARGKHSVAGMGKLVFDMLATGESDETICMKLGVEVEELARLKHITGFSKLFKDVPHSKVVMIKTQAEARAEFARNNPGVPIPEGV